MSAKYFSEKEVAGLDPMLVHMLDVARGIAGFPFYITSGKRTAEHNANVGGVDGSSHIKGLAADLAAPIGHNERETMCWALGLAGFKRIGIYDKHFHVDVDTEKKSPARWFGTSH